MKTFICLIAFCGLICSSYANPANAIEATCGPNEVYKACGTACGEVSCASRFKMINVMCADVCYPGCYCKVGFMPLVDVTAKIPRNCVSVEQCPKLENPVIPGIKQE